jgi:hypothetical protein
MQLAPVALTGAMHCWLDIALNPTCTSRSTNISSRHAPHDLTTCRTMRPETPFAAQVPLLSDGRQGYNGSKPQGAYHAALGCLMCATSLPTAGCSTHSQAHAPTASSAAVVAHRCSQPHHQITAFQQFLVPKQQINTGTKSAPPDAGSALQPPRAWAGCGRATTYTGQR